MSSRLDDQIREMMQHVVDESPPPPVLPTAPPLAPPAAYRFPNWAVAVGAAIAVLVLIGGGIWLIGGGESDFIDSPTVTTAAPSTTATTTTPSTTTTTTSAQGAPAIDGMLTDWQMILLPTDGVSDLFDGEIEGITSEWLYAMPDGRLFVVGWASTFEHEEAALVWSSTDGEQWRRIDLGDRLVFVEGIAPFETGYIARGVTYDGDTYDEASDYRIEYWSSEDGQQWDFVADAPVEEATSHELDSYFSSEYAYDILDSTDNWSAIEPEPPPGDCLGAHGLLISSDGTTTAICRDTDLNVMSDELVTFWGLTDQDTWEALDIQQSLEDQFGRPVTKLEFGEISDMGGYYMTDPTSDGYWISADGRTWSFIDVELSDFPSGSRTETVRAVGDQLIIVGQSANNTPTIWISPLP